MARNARVFRSALFGVIALSSSLSSAQLVQSTWLGGAGSWSNAASWSGGVVPNNGVPAGRTYDVTIDGSVGAGSVAISSGSYSINNLTITADDELKLLGGSRLTLNPQVAGGTIALRVDGAVSMLNWFSPTGTTTLTLNAGADGTTRVLGTGTLAFWEGAYINGSGTLQIDSRLEGNGWISGLNVVNNGVIRGVRPSGNRAMVIELPSTELVNRGEIRADHGVAFFNPSSFHTGTVNNSAGSITVRNGGNVNIGDGILLHGGRLVSEGTGAFYITSSPSNPATLRDVSIAGNFFFAVGGSQAKFSGNISLEPGALLACTATGTMSVNAGSAVFSGDGSLALSGFLVATNSTITNRVLLSGSGRILTQGSGILVNESTVATQVSAAKFFNSGTFLANVPLRTLNAREMHNAGGLIKTTAGSTLQVEGTPSSTITYGNIQVDSSSRLLFPSGTVILNSVTLNSNGTLQVDGGQLRIESGSFTLSGGTVLVQNGTPLYEITGDNAVFRNIGATIHGTGAIGGASLGIFNSGTILEGKFAPGAAGFVNVGTILGAVFSGSAGGTFDSTASVLKNVSLVEGAVLSSATIQAAFAAVDNSSATVTAVRMIKNSPDNLLLEDTARLTIRAGGGTLGTSRIPALFVLRDQSTIDLTDHDLIIGFSAATVEPIFALRTGYAGGQWTGTQITSSIAAQDATNGLLTGIGCVRSQDIFTSFPAMFGGQPIDAADYLLRYTLMGDANLDRRVDIADFARLAPTFNVTSPTSRWFNGDFNYDAITNIADFALLAANFNQSLPADLPRENIPEPAAFAGATFVTFLLRDRRHTR